MSLPQSFYQKLDTLSLAKELLGCMLVHETSEGTTTAIIVETEAYLHDDPACHAYWKRTPRNEDMFLPAGMSYIYQIYGIYFCFNVVSSKVDIGEAVLIRALEPIQGIELMTQRRTEMGVGKKKAYGLKDLCSGPGKLVQAMGITKNQSGQSLAQGNLYIKRRVQSDFRTFTTTRIGIPEGKGNELPYRFYIENNPFISKK